MIERIARARTQAIKRLQAQIPQFFRPASVVLVAILCQAHAVAAVGWNVAAPMATPRAQHAGALMDDGSVGVFGGVNRTGFVVGSERYAGGVWTSLGNSGIQGNVTEAATLGTGHVLVRSDGSLNAGLYDPVANAWSAAGTQTVLRSLPSMTLLSSGKVLVAGGSNLNSAELYDPLTRTWTATGSMSVVRHGHGAVLLRDGRVLVASGFSTSAGEVPAAEIYDPTTGTWTLAAPPLVPRHYASLTLLPDGRALLAGGFSGGGVTNHAEIYDPVANTWTVTAAMQRPRSGAMGSPLAHATVLASGQVLVGGGSDNARNTQPLAELYDAALGTWSPAGSMVVGRENGTANLLPNGDVLMAGGYSSIPSLTFYDSVEFYTPAVPAGPAPVVDMLPLLQRASTALTLTGTGFTGATATSTPQLQLQRAENGAITTFAPTSHTDTTFTSGAIGTLPAGLYMARLVVDGVPSVARLVRFTDPAGMPSGTAGNAQVAMNWVPPANDGGNPPVGYTVTSSPASAGCTATAPATSCTVTGLANGTAYTFTARAQHPNGPGPLSLPSAAITPVANQYTGPSPGGAGPVSVVVNGGGPTCTLVGSDTSITTPPAGAPAQLAFPYGVFQFRASGCVTGSTLQIGITYPNPLPANIEFWKYGPAVPAAASTWFVYPGTTLSPDRRTVTYSVTDNGVGDSDSANGVVLDPLGAALAPPALGATPVPGLSPAGVALATLMIAFAMGWRGRGSAKRSRS